MTDDASPPEEYDVAGALQEVGLLCTQWTHLGWYLEIAVWYFLNLLDGSGDGRLITAPFQAEKLARLASSLAHRKLTDTDELNAMKHIADEVNRLNDERSLAVHGLREVRPGEVVLATVPRGKYKNKLQLMSLIRLRTLNKEVKELIDIIEPLLEKHGALEGSGPIERAIE